MKVVTRTCKLCDNEFRATQIAQFFCEDCKTSAEKRYGYFYSVLRRSGGGLAVCEFLTYIGADTGMGSSNRVWKFDTDDEAEAVAKTLAAENRGFLVYVDRQEGGASHFGHPIMKVWDERCASDV